MAEAFTWSTRVRYAECDMQGHVFNAHYLTWADTAHTEMMRAAVGPHPELVASGVDFVVAEARVRYRAAAGYDDEIAFDVAVAAVGETSMTTAMTVRRGADTIAEIEVRHVCVDAETFRKRPWPDHVRAGVARFAAA